MQEVVFVFKTCGVRRRNSRSSVGFRAAISATGQGRLEVRGVEKRISISEILRLDVAVQIVFRRVIGYRGHGRRNWRSAAVRERAGRKRHT